MNGMVANTMLLPSAGFPNCRSVLIVDHPAPINIGMMRYGSGRPRLVQGNVMCASSLCSNDSNNAFLFSQDEVCRWPETVAWRAAADLRAVSSEMPHIQGHVHRMLTLLSATSS